MVEVRIPVRWADMDAYGHVNNAVFLNYLEEARDLLSDRLFGDSGFDFVVARVAIDFRQEVKQADGAVVVTSRADGYGRSSVRTVEMIRLEDGTLCAEAQTVLVPRNQETGRSRPLTEAERAMLDAALTES